MLKPRGDMLMMKDDMPLDLRSNCQVLDLECAYGQSIVFTSPNLTLSVPERTEIYLIHTDVALPLH
jgi:hypothetical protein